MNILVINCGSSTVKYQLLDVATESIISTGIIETDTMAHGPAVQLILKENSNFSIDAVGHRVVHGGDSFHDAVEIDDNVITRIEDWVPMAPLHNPANLAGISAARRCLPLIPHVAVFDTAFHTTLPRRAYTYAIDPEIARKHHIRRYGFHGTSHQYVAQQAAIFLGQPLNELKIITLHLGNGARHAPSSMVIPLKQAWE